jgi:hypothetical protein
LTRIERPSAVKSIDTGAVQDGHVTLVSGSLFQHDDAVADLPRLNERGPSAAMSWSATFPGPLQIKRTFPESDAALSVVRRPSLHSVNQISFPFADQAARAGRS